MKIGIVTLSLHNNFGGILQAWALQTALERMGCDVEVLETEKTSIKEPSGVVALLRYSKRILKKVLGMKSELFVEKRLLYEKNEIEKHTRAFVERNIHLHRYPSFSKLGEGEFDAFVVGSDQVWRPKYFALMVADIEDAYLRFTKDWDVKRVAYAASFGTNDWEYSERQTSACKKLVSKFDAISVREANAVQLVRNHFSCEAEHLLDPTMLLSSSDYQRLFETGQTNKSPGGLMCCILDANEQTELFVDRLAKEMGLVSFRANASVDDRSLPLSQRVQPPVEQWLRYFYDAEYVVTDSFHACVFSIIFRKQFVVLGNEGRGMDRFTSLLALFGLEERLVSDVKRVSSLQPIDYDRVYCVLGAMREKSISFLRACLDVQ